jgi:streptogramin lyase
MWLTEIGRDRIARVSPSGRGREYRTEDSPTTIARGGDGALWFTTLADTVPFETLSGLGRITMSGRVREFFVRSTCHTWRYGIAAARDGSLWFNEFSGPVSVGRLDPVALTANAPRG